MHKINLPADKQIYFASDFHLGTPNAIDSLAREKSIVRWLEHIAPTAHTIFLLGDVFDFWFEYKTVVPKGFVRLQGALAKLTDAGVNVHFFKGNHDMWVKDYFIQELGLIQHSNEYVFECDSKLFYLHHGDGIGPGDYNYKRLKRIFRSPFAQTLFGMLPPVIGLGIANAWSRGSRIANNDKEQYLGKEQEWLYQYCVEVSKQVHYHHFIFGHRHLPLQLSLPAGNTYINLGEWVHQRTYASYSSIQGLQTHTWEQDKDLFIKA